LHLVIWFFCRKLSPHTWRAYGPKGIRFTATFTPSGFERFFQEIERRHLLATDVGGLRAVAADVGMDCSATIWMRRRRQSEWPFWRSRGRMIVVARR
jgi:hypothetical protein